MKNLKHLLVAILIILISGYITIYLNTSNQVLIFVACLIIAFFIFNSIIRKSLSFKNYFLSPYNVLTSKEHFEKSFDIPKELMFDKILEVLQSSNFKVVDTDKATLEILAISSLNLKTWGENLYIQFENVNDSTKMKFSSSTLFQMYSWGKNEKNFEELLHQIENSLTI